MKNSQKMTFIEHLEELRWVLMRVLILNFIIVCISFYYSSILQNILLQPITSMNLSNFQLQDIKITSPFMSKIVISLFTAVLISFPYIIFELYRFMYPVFSQISKTFLIFLYIFSVILFLIGCFFGYKYLLPVSITFFVKLVDTNVIFSPERINYIFYSYWLIIVCGLVYQLPVVTLFLTKLRIITYYYLKQMRPYSVVLFLVLGAFLSPPDPLSQLLLAVPLLILYEISIMISYFFRVTNE